MKKLVSLALLGATSSLMALGAEHAYLYKDARIMSMGGANVAVGGYSTSVFHNPAGLAKIKQEHGIVVDLLGIGITGSENFQDFADDMGDVDDMPTENQAQEALQTVAMIDLLKKYSGENFHLDASNYSSVSKNHGNFAWSVGFLAAGDMNYMPHGNGSPSGGILETTTKIYGGVMVGAAVPYETPYGKVDIGLGFKFVTLTSIEGSLGITELLDDDEDSDIADTLEEKYKKESTGFGIDIGAIFHPFANTMWKPSFGISILNIGSMSMDDNYGGQPMTVNIGASISPEIAYIDKLVLAVDYVDLFNANNTRIYDYSTDGEVHYTDYQEADFMKRLRIGASVGLWDNMWVSTTLNLGLYQGAYTAGIDTQLTILKLTLATYEEQVGTGSVDIADRRYMAQIGIGW